MSDTADGGLKLRVAEALPKDMGRGLARLDPADMARLGLEVGDIVEIAGKRKTVGKAMPAYKDQRGQARVQIDGLSRENAGTALDQLVEVRKARPRPAEKVVLSALNFTPRERDLAYIGSRLDGLPVVAGDRARVALFGSRSADFQVVSTAPAGPVVIHATTLLAVEKSADKADKEAPRALSYEDIGGLKREIHRIREIIELPLRYPEVFERLGIAAPKGVLLHGPPGCGKTLIARAVAHETEARFFSVNGPEIIHKFYGESLAGDERILVLEDGRLKRKPICQVVAEELPNLQVPCFGTDGHLRWGRVTGFFQHRCRGRLLQVRTVSGRTIRVTDDHSLFTVDAQGIRSIPTSDLIPGRSFVAIPKKLPFAPEPLDHLNLLTLLQDDEEILARGPYVEDLLRHAYSRLTRQRCAEILQVPLRYTCDLLSKHVGVRLPHLLRLTEEARLPLIPAELKLTSAKRSKGLKAVLPLDEDLCTFFGLWLAEGSFSKGRSVRLSIHKDELDLVVPLCQRLFGEVTIYCPNGSEGRDVIVSSIVLVKAMQALGFRDGAPHQRVPEFGYSLSRENLAALLRGYISGDGSVNTTTPAPQVEVGTSSPELADDICLLLLFFGLVAKVYDKEAENSKRISFADAANLNYFQEIGFLQQAKNEIISRYLATQPTARRDRLPLAAVRDLLGWRGAAYDGLSGIGVAASRRYLTPFPETLKPACDGDLCWDKVAAVEEMPEQPEHVYDIAVSPGENFVAGFGGIFAHNSEAHLRKIFDEATKQAPSVIFLDEIDAIAPRRENVVGEVEKRVVAQLLALMDGLARRQHVMVIAATNLPNLLDPALRRPGRFDREIAIRIPDRDGRREILDIHSRGMPLAADVDLDQLAGITHGFVGADLEALCREAAMICLRRILPEFDFSSGQIPYEALMKLEVRMGDFQDALCEVEPSAIREVFVEVPDVRWQDVGGLPEVKARLIEAVEWPLRHPHLFAQAGIRPPKGILLSGPPGCGKTLLAKAVATESQVNFISVKGPALLSKYVGESEKGVREVFKKARQAAPCIVFFDEIDALVPARGGGTTDSHVAERVLSQFLAELDGVEELKGVLVLGATNRPDLLDPAILRPGRFDQHVEIPLPDERGRREIFQVHLRDKPLAAETDLEELAAQSEGCSGADVAGVCHRAALEAVRRAVVEVEAGRPGAVRITVEDLRDALAELPPVTT